MVQREEVSKACDVYSYGMLLFEIATRHIPFPDVGPVMAAIMTMDGKVGHSEDITHFREYPYTIIYHNVQKLLNVIPQTSLQVVYTQISQLYILHFNKSNYLN